MTAPTRGKIIDPAGEVTYETLDDAQPIGTARVVVGIVSLLVFVLCFVPDPLVFSWRDALHELGLGRFLP